jgi:hypothetical protein
MEYVLSCRGFIRLGYVNSITSKSILDGFRNFVEFFYYLATCLVVQFINVLDVLFGTTNASLCRDTNAITLSFCAMIKLGTLWFMILQKIQSSITQLSHTRGSNVQLPSKRNRRKYVLIAPLEANAVPPQAWDSSEPTEVYVRPPTAQTLQLAGLRQAPLAALGQDYNDCQRSRKGAFLLFCSAKGGSWPRLPIRCVAANSAASSGIADISWAGIRDLGVLFALADDQGQRGCDRPEDSRRARRLGKSASSNDRIVARRPEAKLGGFTLP